MENGKELFFVLIRNQEYPVYDIPEKTHGKDNSTLWIKSNIFPLFDKVEYIPYIEKNCKKFLWDISIKEGNSMEYNGETHVTSSYITTTLKINDREIYSFYSDNIDNAYHDAKEKIKKLQKLPFSVFDYNKLKGRKIYYKGLPATIILGYFTDGHIVIVPDCNKKDLDNWWNGLKEPWLNIMDLYDLKLNKTKNSLNIDILDTNIHWFRNDRKSKLLKIIQKIKG